MSTNRRMRRNRMQEMYLKKRSTAKDSEGNTYEVFSDTAQSFSGEHWPASGKVQAQIYGERLGYIRNLKISGKYSVVLENGKTVYQYENGMTVSELDGVCIDAAGTEEPDYRIISIKPYRPLRLEVEKR